MYGNVWHLLDSGQWVPRDPHHSADSLLLQALRNIMLGQTSAALHALFPWLVQRFSIVTSDQLRDFFAEEADRLRGDLTGDLEDRANDLAGAWEESLEDIHALINCQEDSMFEHTVLIEQLRDMLKLLQGRVEGFDERVWVMEEQHASLSKDEPKVDPVIRALEARLDASESRNAKLEAENKRMECKLEDRLRALEARLDASESRNAKLESENERLRALVEISVHQIEATMKQSESIGEPLRESVALLRKDWELRTAEFDKKIDLIKKLVKVSMERASDCRDQFGGVETLCSAAQTEILVMRKELSNLCSEVLTIRRAIDPVEANEIDAKTWEKLQVFIRDHREGITEEEMRAFLRTHFGSNEEDVERGMATYWVPISMAMQRCAEDRKQAAATAGAARSKSKKDKACN